VQYKTIEPCPKCGRGTVIVTWERAVGATSTVDAEPVSGQGCRNEDCEWFEPDGDQVTNA